MKRLQTNTFYSTEKSLLATKPSFGDLKNVQMLRIFTESVVLEFCLACGILNELIRTMTKSYYSHFGEWGGGGGRTEKLFDSIGIAVAVATLKRESEFSPTTSIANGIEIAKSLTHSNYVSASNAD